MGYTAVDLIEKCAEIEMLVYKLYLDLSNNDSYDKKIKLVAKVLAKEELRHIDVFDMLKEEYKDDTDYIEFKVYDKASKLASELKSKINLVGIKDVKDLVTHALDIESSNIALLLSIKDELVNDSKDLKINSYTVLEKLIDEERGHVKNLKAFIQ